MRAMILRERGFADARRSPQDDRTELIALDLHPQRLARSQDMLLADKLFERLRTHALGQRALAVVFQAGQGIRFKQAHIPPAILCLRATNSAMPAASAALSDSTPTVGIRIGVALSRSRSLTPRPSLPTMMAHLLAQLHFANVGGALGHQRKQRDLALLGCGQKQLLIERGGHRNAEDGSG